MKFQLIKVYIALFFCLIIQISITSKVHAQFSTIDFQQDAIGWGIWYGFGVVKLDAPGESESNETKGYSNVLPSEINGRGYAIGISYGQFGINYGQDTGEAKIDKYADTQQNSISSDDVYVYTAKRVNRSITVLYQPIRYLYLGLGQDTGHIEFEQRLPSGVKETNKVPYENNFYSLGLAFGFDPTTNAIAPIFTVYTKIPTSRSKYNGTMTGIGGGVYF